MGWKVRSGDLLACGIGLSSAAIIFVLLVFDGVRVSTANNVLFLAALSINLLGFVFAAVERSKGRIIVSGLFSLALIIAVVWGAMECFCMGGGCNDRFDNCSGTRTPYVGLLNAMALATNRLKSFIVATVSVFVALPAMALWVQKDQSRAIQRALADIDLRNRCFIQAEHLHSGLPGLEQSRRVVSATSIDLAYFKGEELPRFILLKDEKLFIWKFSQKEFVPMSRFVQERRGTEFSEFCKLQTLGEIQFDFGTFVAGNTKAVIRA